MTEYIDVNTDSFDEIILHDNIQPEIEAIPFSTLPYAFKERIINLAPIPELSHLYKSCPEFGQMRRCRLIERDQVYIASNDDAIRCALQKQRYFNIFKLPIIWFRYALDGPDNFFATWKSVLPTDKIIENNKPISVTDTLNIHCESVQQFETVIPYICGNYHRLSIRGGKISWSQVKRLIHEDVKQVQIFAEIVDLDPWGYDDFVLYLKQFLKGFHHRIAFRVDGDYASYGLKQQLQRAFKDHNTNVFFCANRSYFLVNRNSRNVYFGIATFLICIWAWIAIICTFLYKFWDFYNLFPFIWISMGLQAFGIVLEAYLSRVLGPDRKLL